MHNGSQTARTRGAASPKALRDRLRRRCAKAGLRESPEVAYERHPLGHRKPAGGQQCERKMQRRGQAPRLHGDASCSLSAKRAHRQRESMEERRGRAGRVDALNHCQRAPVGADDEVLAVVERDAGKRDAPRATAQGSRLLDQGDAQAVLGELDRGGAARPAAADDGDMMERASHGRRAVFHATQSLRSGVSAIRWSRTP